MRKIAFLLIGCCSAVGAAETLVRNPFIPVEKPCASPFSAWRLRGVVGSGADAAVAVVNTPQGWRRLKPGDEAAPGWRAVLSAGSLVLDSTQKCPSVVITGEGAIYPKGDERDRMFTSTTANSRAGAAIRRD